MKVTCIYCGTVLNVARSRIARFTIEKLCQLFCENPDCPRGEYLSPAPSPSGELSPLLPPSEEPPPPSEELPPTSGNY